MKALRLLIAVFALGISLPLGYLVVHTYRSLEAEEAATLSFFAEALFDEIQADLEALVRREQARPIDAYSLPAAGGAASPLVRLPAEDFIRGYFQNNPDGGLQTPHGAAGQTPAREEAARLAELEEVNRVFNRKRAEGTDRIRAESGDEKREDKRRDGSRFAERYLDSLRSQRAKSTLGEQDSRLEAVTPEQALNVAKLEKKAGIAPSPYAGRPGSFVQSHEMQAPAAAMADAAAGGRTNQAAAAAPSGDLGSLQVEIAPFQSVFIDDGRVFTFRRILIDGRMYRQGFVLQLDALLSHLARTHFSQQPMARFTRLKLRAVDQGRETRVIEAGPSADRPRMVLNRSFPTPLNFLRATLSCDAVPPSAGRSTLNLALAALGGVILMGLFAIYQSTKKIVDFSERQSRFVSSVTHELKTPLTNIRMYIEMLEQGMARDPEREQEYFRILQSEGARLSRLITNVLDLSKLEKKHRRPNLQEGDFAEVIADVEGLMGESLKQHGFVLACENEVRRPFRYDREIMVQVLVNLIENSVKFGKSQTSKRIILRLTEAGERVRIEVADTGPGIPPGDVKKIFNDFYRAENAVTAAAGGTGIGLALVRRFVALLGGTVSADNNTGPGCTIRIELPR